MIQHGGWQTITHDGTDVQVRAPDGPSRQAQAYIERNKTFVFLMSETLTGDELATLAAGLKPALSTRTHLAAGDPDHTTRSPRRASFRDIIDDTTALRRRESRRGRRRLHHGSLCERRRPGLLRKPSDAGSAVVVAVLAGGKCSHSNSTCSPSSSGRYPSASICAK
jgi:hypothetical protein